MVTKLKVKLIIHQVEYESYMNPPNRLDITLDKIPFQSEMGMLRPNDAPAMSINSFARIQRR